VGRPRRLRARVTQSSERHRTVGAQGGGAHGAEGGMELRGHKAQRSPELCRVGGESSAQGVAQGLEEVDSVYSSFSIY
jgi:hypothetical protein